MALSASTESAPSGAMGDAIPGVAAREVEVSSTRHILCNHSEPWDTHILHDRTADTLLVWAFGSRERVSPRAALCDR